MEIKVYDTIKEVALTTVSLVHNDGAVHLFHCPNCGNSIAQIQGWVVKIYPTYEPTTDVMVLNRCRECGTIFNFQTHDFYKNKAIKVKVKAPQVTMTWHCFKCRQPLLSYDPAFIRDLVSSSITRLPHLLKCSNCQAEYNFYEMI